MSRHQRETWYSNVLWSRLHWITITAIGCHQNEQRATCHNWIWIGWENEFVPLLDRNSDSMPKKSNDFVPLVVSLENYFKRNWWFSEAVPIFLVFQLGGYQLQLLLLLMSTRRSLLGNASEKTICIHSIRSKLDFPSHKIKHVLKICCNFLQIQSWWTDPCLCQYWRCQHHPKKEASQLVRRKIQSETRI